jgi:inorganic pyrophosphatase
VIDRPIGSTHLCIPDLIYLFDYGYLQDTISTDQSGIDIWLGDHEDKILDALICTIDLKKNGYRD